MIGLLLVMRSFPFMAALPMRCVYVLSGTLSPSVGRLQQLERNGGRDKDIVSSQSVKESFLVYTGLWRGNVSCREVRVELPPPIDGTHD